jgi:hypothetical protein
MRLLTNILLVCAALVAFGLWSRQQRRVVAERAAWEAATSPNANGFVPMPAWNDPPAGKVWIVAALNCPRPAGLRADGLVSRLAEDGIVAVRVAQVSFSFDQMPTQAEKDRISKVMNGELPVVFVNGRAKNNPQASEIVAELRAGGR